MSTCLVFDERGRVRVVTGSPGESRIIAYTAQSIFSMIDLSHDPCSRDSFSSPPTQSCNHNSVTSLCSDRRLHTYDYHLGFHRSFVASHPGFDPPGHVRHCRFRLCANGQVMTAGMNGSGERGDLGCACVLELSL